MGGGGEGGGLLYLLKRECEVGDALGVGLEVAPGEGGWVACFEGEEAVEDGFEAWCGHGGWDVGTVGLLVVLLVGFLAYRLSCSP